MSLGTLVRVLLGVVFLSVPLAAQDPTDDAGLDLDGVEPTVIGLVAGWNVNDGIWKPEAETEAVGGVVLGGFANAATPVRWFGVRAELLWTQRGLDVVDALGAPAGSVRADYLTLTLHARVWKRIGPVRFHAAAGPTVDQTVQRKTDAVLGPALTRDVGTAFGVSAGGGVGFLVASRYRVELEARWLEGLSDAHSGDFVSARNRSLEFLTRVGIPRPRN
jgi:hypothetical protein